MFLRPHLQRLIERKQAMMQRVRILDLGCGSADGYELLTGVRQRESDLEDVEVHLLTPEVLGRYKGVDLNEDLLAQARGIYGDNPKLEFSQADFLHGVPITADEKPYDLYFTSYGTCSITMTTKRSSNCWLTLLGDVDSYAVVFCDWLDATLRMAVPLTNDLSENRNMDYVVSYIYEAEEREQRRNELQHLCLRLVSRQEAEAIIAEASRRQAWRSSRSLLRPRRAHGSPHGHSGYNSHAQPLRQAVNSLHEDNLRTDLSTLLFDYAPKSGFEFINDYFEHLQMC